MLKICLILPVYNEEKTIIDVIDSANRILKDKVDLDIIVSDNGSNDKTHEYLIKRISELGTLNNIKILKANEKRGKGYAIKTAFMECIRVSSYDFYIINDADNTYSMEYLLTLIEHASTNELDMLVCSRKFHVTGVANKIRQLGNYLFSNMFNLVAKLNRKNIHLIDPLSGFRIISRSMYKSVYRSGCVPDGFEVEMFFNLYAMIHNLRCQEFFINYEPRGKNNPSKLNALIDGYKILKYTATFSKKIVS